MSRSTFKLIHNKSPKQKPKKTKFGGTNFEQQQKKKRKQKSEKNRKKTKNADCAIFTLIYDPPPAYVTVKIKINTIARIY